MLEWIAKYWLQVLFTALSSVCVCTVKKLYGKVHKEHKEQSDLKAGLLALLRNSIICSYNEYILRGWIPIYALDSIRAMYEAYHALGGNGTVTKLFQELTLLPSSQPHRSTNKESEGTCAAKKGC